MKEHLFHASYKESKDKPKIEAMFDQLPGKDFELKLPNPDYPKYPIITSEKRVAFKPLFDAIYAEARADGCIWIPFEETSPKPKLSYAEQQEQAAAKAAANQLSPTQIVLMNDQSEQQMFHTATPGEEEEKK